MNCAMLAIQTLPHELSIRGRTFSSSELDLIRGCVNQYYDRGRTQISKIICEKLDWRQANGWLKDRACYDVLINLEKKGLIQLPAPRNKGGLPPNHAKKPTQKRIIGFDLITPIITFPSTIELEFVKSKKSTELWNELIDNYHYLGHRITVGRHIKYIVWSDTRIIGALAFSSPAWHIAPRDLLLKSIGIEEKTIRDSVINNTRFLILPNVSVPNLASTLLSTATKQVVKDWYSHYCITPLVAETFVQPSLYLGTCYKAANWLEIGTTKGYTKKGYNYLSGKEPKKIFIYGLDRYIRQKIRKVSDVCS